MAKIHEGPVYLEPIEHVYISRKTGKKYTSVTKVLSSIEEHFDSEAVATAIARQSDSKKKEKYIGLTKDDILLEWKRINDEANEYGTKIHETIEKYILNKWYRPKDELEAKVIKAYKDFKVDEGIEMYPERIMFSEEYELAGTSDLIIDIDDEWFDCGDWKSNREFNFYSNFKKTLKYPFQHLQDCQYSIYSLQLSVYCLMYEKETGKKCRQIWIGYWDRLKETLIRIPIIYLRHEAQMLLDYFKNLKKEEIL